MRYRIVWTLIGLVLSTMVMAQTAEQKGLEIAGEADRRNQGYVDSTANLRMILKNRQGRETTRELHVRALEVQGDGDKSLMIFAYPPDINGTAFLSFTHVAKADDQWLYLPALKRVKRISSANKSGPFMASEFAYEDLTSPEVGRYRYRYLRDEVLDGQETFVIERMPTYEKSGYKRQLAWIDKVHYRTIKIDYYDRGNSLLKVLVSSNFQQYLGRYWRPLRMRMANRQTGKSTHLIWRDYAFRTGFSKQDFSPTALKRVR